MWWPFSSTPSLNELQRIEPLRDAMKADINDCMSCRITGAGAFMGLGAYSYFSGHRQLQLNQARILKSKSMIGFRGRQIGITSIAASFVGLGIYRLVN